MKGSGHVIACVLRPMAIRSNPPLQVSGIARKEKVGTCGTDRVAAIYSHCSLSRTIV